MCIRDRLNTLAVAGVYWLTRRTWGAPAALAGALLLAAGPWAIIFSRKIWAQNLLPPFAIGWGIGAALAFVEGRLLTLALQAAAGDVPRHGIASSVGFPNAPLSLSLIHI